MVDKETEQINISGPDTDKPGAPELDVSKNPPVAPPPLLTEIHEHDGRRWPTIIVYLLIALAVAVLIVFGARALYHAFHKPHKPAPAPTGDNNPPTKPTGNKSQPKKPAKKPAAQPNSDVPNTGPGNTVAMFAGVAIAIGGLHYILSVRRAKN